MLSVAKAVEHIISQKPFVQEGLSRGIINNAALANEMIPEVERLLKKKVKFSSVNMAIRRLSEKMERTFAKKAKFDKSSNLTMISDLVEITIFRIDNIQEYIRKLYDIINYQKGDFITITQGVYEIMIIINGRHEDEILELFPEKIVKKVLRNLCGITLKLPEDSFESAGLFYIITRSLAWENIIIVDIVSTLTEVTLTFNDADGERAFRVLKTLVKENM